jgi:hypothetical protein
MRSMSDNFYSFQPQSSASGINHHFFKQSLIQANTGIHLYLSEQSGINQQIRYSFSPDDRGIQVKQPAEVVCRCLRQ